MSCLASWLLIYAIDRGVLSLQPLVPEPMQTCLKSNPYSFGNLLPERKASFRHDTTSFGFVRYCYLIEHIPHAGFVVYLPAIDLQNLSKEERNNIRKVIEGLKSRLGGESHES